VRGVVSTINAVEFEYEFACTRKGVHLNCFVSSPGKMIFAVLEL